ncbi:NACHT-ANK domain protein transcript variant 1 [Tuber borchii]|uniref:NACHT-ANK domain protein transcript variant 1 n=1 Tax=Tuber borchii TaxID=42251 RepID=A0A2T7A6W6_TUBBO|nr:NACHT-ANK domain protein transcript variant 1 [Tuber borchii]
MGNQQSRAPLRGTSAQELTVAQSDIRGNYNGNNGSHNNFHSGNTTTNHYHGGMNTSDYSEISQCLYTSEYKSHRNRIREPVEGTCTWVIEHPKYKDWLDERSSGLLWLSADPGSGKSVIASFLAGHLETRDNTIVCYFFFKDDSDEQRSAKFALCAILHQLFEQQQPLHMCAQKAFASKGKRFIEDVNTLWEILVQAAKGANGDVICVMDAFDECEKGTRNQLIRHMIDLLKLPPSDTVLKFLVTSRPYHDIAVELTRSVRTIQLKGEDEVKAISTAVSQVIDEGVKHLESYWESPGGLGYLRNLLESSADRTFLWVALVLKILEDSADNSREAFTRIVSDTPHDLTELYTKILDKSSHPEGARRILHIVVGATRPLTLAEIFVAFRIRQHHRTTKDIEVMPLKFETTVKNLCGLFIRIIDSKVYLVHQTAREFLIKGRGFGAGNWQHTLCPTRILTLCWPIFKYALLDYAASNWAGHFRCMQDRHMELFGRSRLICKTGSNTFFTWLKVYWERSGQSQSYEFESNLTHLMIAAWLGQKEVVGRLLQEADSKYINASSRIYGTALNVAAMRKNEDITMMLAGRVNVCLQGKDYNILKVASTPWTNWLIDE